MSEARKSSATSTGRTELSERWKRQLSAMGDMVTVYNREGQFVFINRGGEGAQSLIGLDASQFLLDVYKEAFHDNIAAVYRDGQARDTVSCDLMHNHWEGRLMPLFEEDGSFEFVLSIARPKIMEREVAQAQLADKHLREAIEATGMGTWDWDPICDQMGFDGQARCVNGMELVSENEMSLEDFVSLVYAEDQDKVRRTIKDCDKEEGFRDLEYRRLLPDGSVRWVSCNGKWVAGPKGEALALVGSAFDITERKTVHEQLVQAQKLEAVGQLTAGISHNFNNILSAILPNLHLANRYIGSDGVKFIRNAQLAAERASSLVSELMVVAGRKENEDWQPLDLAEVAERVIRICRTTFGGWVQLNFECDDELPAVLGNEGQLEQVLLNLLLNARDAFEEAAISCPRIDIDLELCRDPSEGQGHLVLRVVDNGPGMDEATRERIFEPFFTTKGKGTGLGLATAYAIVTEHRGGISCWSRPANGTSFEISLPVSDRRASTVPATVASSYVGGDERVLIVDDDSLVRAVTAATLEDAGYSVTEAEGGPEALCLFDDGTNYDLVVLDMGMPELTGDQVLLALRARKPDVRVLVFTGLVDERVASMEEIELLQKPASVNDLLQAVRNTLDLSAAEK